MHLYAGLYNSKMPFIANSHEQIERDSKIKDKKNCSAATEPSTQALLLIFSFCSTFVH